MRQFILLIGYTPVRIVYSATVLLNSEGYNSQRSQWRWRRWHEVTRMVQLPATAAIKYVAAWNENDNGN